MTFVGPVKQGRLAGDVASWALLGNALVPSYPTGSPAKPLAHWLNFQALQKILHIQSRTENGVSNFASWDFRPFLGKFSYNDIGELTAKLTKSHNIHRGFDCLSNFTTGPKYSGQIRPALARGKRRRSSRSSITPKGCAKNNGGKEKIERGTVSVHFFDLLKCLIVVHSCLIATFPQAAFIVQAAFFSEKGER